MSAIIPRAPAGALDEYDAKRLLAAYGVPIVDEAKALDAQSAVAESDRLGYPVVLKGCGIDFAHKTDAGLVHLNLHDAEAVRAAARALLAKMGGRGVLLVQRMVTGPREFLVGMSRDAQFGAFVTFGLGGVFAEALADVALRVCPIAVDDALGMQDEIRGRALLGPVRGLPAVDRNALARAILGVARLALDRPDVDAIDINPLVIDGARPVAVDALVLMKR